MDFEKVRAIIAKQLDIDPETGNVTNIKMIERFNTILRKKTFRSV